MITQQNYKYGAFEARIRGAEGSGMITAFFLYKNGSEWAGAEWQEQDFELFGKNGGFQTQLMTPGDPRVEHVVNHTAATNIWERYYTYRMEWTPTALSFYIDGKLIRRETDAVTYAKLLDPARAEAMNMRISLWAGDIPWSGSFDSTKVPAAVDVNWAQISSYTPGAGPGGSDFTPLWKDDFNSIDYSRWYFANWTFDYAVNDYTPGAARANNGYLQLKMTRWENEGKQFTPSPIDDGALMPPSDTPVDPGTGGGGTGSGGGNGGGSTSSDPTPLAGPVTLPATLEATRPSLYADYTTGNLGDASCYVGDLDAQVSAEGGCNISFSTVGEVQQYDVVATEAGSWNLFVRTATLDPSALFLVKVDGQDVSGVLVPPQSGWQTFVDVAVPTFQLSAGTHSVSIWHLGNGLNIRSLRFEQPGVVLQPPAVVSGLTGSASGSVIGLSWTAAARATSYEVQRGPVGGPYSILGTTSSLAWTDAAVVAGQSYGYVVVAKNASGASLPSMPVSVTAAVPAPADAPSALVATASAGKVVLTWTAGANNTSFRVYRSVDGLTFTQVASPSTPTWTDLTVVNGTSYIYRVTGIFETRESVPTATVTATPMGVAPAPVGPVSVTVGDAKATLSWTAVSGATSYIVSRKLGSGASSVIATVAGTTYADAGLVNGSTYTWSVLASNVWGNAASASSVTGTPVAPPVVTSTVKAQYHPGTTGTTNGIRPLIRLVNTGSSSVPLSEITVRYWFTNEGGKTLTYWCDWAQIGNGNIVATFKPVSPARAGADTYLEIGFKTAAGSLAAGAGTGEIQSRFSKSDWSNFDQSNDASYSLALGSNYADWTKATVYRNGVLIWGVEP